MAGPSGRRPEGYSICVTKSIAAPVEEVFSTFRGSDLSWLGKGTVPVEADGFKDAAGNSAVAIRVRPGKDLRYKWQTAGVPDTTDVDIAFVEKAGKTGITLTHNRIQTREESDGLRKAWSEAFTALKTRLERP